jgi:hypothetical protein
MIRACGLGTHTFRVACEDARGLRAGALIAALGGLCAEGRAFMATTTDGRDVGVEAAELTLTLMDKSDSEVVFAALCTTDLERSSPI